MGRRIKNAKPLPNAGEDGQPRTQFDYLLNAADAAARAMSPFAAGFREKRMALFAYVRALESHHSPLPKAWCEVCKAFTGVVSSPDLWCPECKQILATFEHDVASPSQETPTT